MLRMTYAVCHLLESQDRCERSCLSWSDRWLVSLPSASTLSQSLVLSAVAILRKWKSNVWAGAVTGLGLKGELLSFPHLTPTAHPNTLPVCQVPISLWFLHPWAQILARAARVRRAWPQWLCLCLQSVPVLSKVFHGGLSKAGFFLSPIIHECTVTEWVSKFVRAKLPRNSCKCSTPLNYLNTSDSRNCSVVKFGVCVGIRYLFIPRELT